MIHKGAQRQRHKVSHSTTKLFHSQTISNHTLYSREDPRPLLNTSSAIMIVVYFAKGQCLILTISDFITRWWLEKPPFCHSYTSFGVWPRDHYMPLTRVYYRSMSSFAMNSLAKGPTCNAKDFPAKGPSCTMWFRQITKYVTKNDAHPHPTEQDTQPIAVLISKQVIPYQTCGDTCCPRVSTPEIESLADSSTTYHDSISHLHHSNHCSNHSINPHMVTTHLDGWKTTTPS
jgi:hypothetical protein